MAQSHDGDIQLSVSLSLEDATNAAQRLGAKVSKIFNNIDSSSLDKTSRKLLSDMSKTQSQIEKVGLEIDKITGKMQQASDQEQQYQNVTGEIQRVTEALSEAYDAKKRFADEGVSADSEQWKQAEENIKACTERLAELKSTKEQLEQQEPIVVTEDEIARLGVLKDQMGDLNNTTVQQLSAWESLGGEVDKSSQRFNNLGDTIRKSIPLIGKFVESGMRLAGLGSVMDGVKNKLSQFTSKLRGASNANNSFGNSLKQTIKKFAAYALGIASLTSLFSKLRSAVSWGITAMAKMNGGVNQTNKAMTQLTSMLNLVKGSLAAAFTPILTAVTPMLSNFMQQLANVITMIGMFIAKLTGAKSYMKATFKATDFASGGSGGGSGKSAQEKYEEAVKKAQEKYDKQVAKIEEQNANAQSKAAEKNAKAEEKQAKAADKLAKAQEKANNKLAAFDDLNVLGIDNTEDAVDELEEYEAELKELPELELPNLEDFLGGGGGGAGDPFGLEEIPLDGIEWNWDDLLAKAQELGRKLGDFLNDVFKDEDLAKKIGNTIGNLINMAINFVYGFVDQFNFHQFGRWIGALLQEAIETIDWALLGQTMAKGLNGIADSIIGFFETYNVGTLGSSISTMLNNAIHEIDAGKIGQATLDVLQAPLLELREVLTETHWKELGAKVSEWFHKVFSSEGLKGESLGTTIGRTLGAEINAAIDFLLGLDISQAITDIGMFFTDIFVGAANEIDWPNFFELIEHALLGFVEGLGTIAAIWGGMICVSLEEAINDKLHIEIFKQEDIEHQKKEIELLREGLVSVGSLAEESGHHIVDMFSNIGDGMQYSFDQLVRFQSGAGLTNEQIEAMIESMQEYARTNGETFDAAALGLEGYTGNWQTFRDTVLGIVDETNEKITSTDGVVKDLSSTTDLLAEKTRNVGSTIKEEADTTAEKLDHTATIGKDHLGILDAAIDTSDTNVNEYSDSAVEALSKVDAKTGEVSINFEQMTQLVQTQLDSLTTMIDTWYQEMITQYFSYDAWLLMLQEGPLLALTDFFTLLSTEFDTQMQTLWTEHLLIWFANDKWQAEIYTPWYTFLQTKWKNLLVWWDKVIKEWFKDLSEVRWKKLMKWWDESMTTWWNDKVIPWFEEELWREQFLHVYDVAEEVGKKTRDKIKELAEETADAVHEACDAMIGWIEEVIAKLKEAIALAQQLAAMEGGGGGGGSSSSSGGSRGGSTSPGGGGGHIPPFMPMLDVMHFEDNLGMSAFKFPELATGAVIPPNNEFLAILGDQRNGMNIETPLSTMIEAFRSVMDEYMGGSHQSATMEVDGETFARLMMPHIMDEMNRLGYNTEIIEGM